MRKYQTKLTTSEKAQLFDEIIEKTIEASKQGIVNGNALAFQNTIKNVVVDMITKHYTLQ